MVLTITAFVCVSIFGAIGYFEKIKPGGKLSMSTVIAIILCILVIITGIADIVFKSTRANADKKEILDKIDSVLKKEEDK